jgi:UDP-glucuronate 4-epimerase
MNELQLSTYRDLFGLGVYALRFFTVYGPRQRPDMAIAKFTRAISRGQPITLFGDGSSRRDYTYIDDIVAGVHAAIDRVTPGAYEIYNLGGTATISLAELVGIVERVVGRTAVIDRQPDQPGDVPLTYANIERARAALDYAPTTRPEVGIERYWEWLRASDGQRRQSPA